MTINKKDYEAWKGLELTKEVFKLWAEYIDETNVKLASGEQITADAHTTLVNYSSIVGYNKMFREIQEYSFEELTGIVEELTEEEEHDDTTKNTDQDRAN